jgi:hypothetical protein
MEATLKPGVPIRNANSFRDGFIRLTTTPTEIISRKD